MKLDKCPKCGLSIEEDKFAGSFVILVNIIGLIIVGLLIGLVYLAWN